MTVFQISCDNVKQHCWGFYVALDMVNVSYVIGHGKDSTHGWCDFYLDFFAQAKSQASLFTMFDIIWLLHGNSIYNLLIKGNKEN